MSDDWARVDDYINGVLVPADPALEAALAANAAAGLPAIDVAPNQGKLLHILARMVGARRILEIGTLGGYSTIWLARALPPDGRLVTLEAEPAPRRGGAGEPRPRRARRPGRGARRAGARRRCRRWRAPFDLVFIDADKRSNPDYLDWALQAVAAGQRDRLRQRDPRRRASPTPASRIPTSSARGACSSGSPPSRG